MRKGIRLKPMRRDLPARCERCHQVVKLTARETRLIDAAGISHTCGLETPARLVYAPPMRDIRGRLVLLV